MSDFSPFPVSDPVEIILDVSRKSPKRTWLHTICPLCKKMGETIARGNGTRYGHTYCYSCARIYDYRDMKVGKPTVVTYIPSNDRWFCVCECGETATLRRSSINATSGTKSCGCGRRRSGDDNPVYDDMAGRRFGRWTVIEFVGGPQSKRLCRCDCGTISEIAGGALKSGNSKSCGCLNRELSSERMTGESNPFYIDGRAEDRDRASIEYTKWRRAVMRRDGYTCQRCGSTKDIIAHHLYSYARHTGQRYDTRNGIVLCYECHSEFHNTWMGHYRIPCTRQDYFDWCRYKQKEVDYDNLCIYSS